MSINTNKVGTCKCVDYFNHKNNNYIKQSRKIMEILLT